MAFKHTYEQMLDKLYKKLPKSKATSSRFEIPKVQGRIQGNRTIITNLQQIAKALRSKPEHLMKFLLRELATTGDMKTGGTLFVGKFGSTFLNKKIEKYVKEFVLCSQCGKPDTSLMKEKGITFKKCEACGAKSSVRTLK
jgi:translation initiation factor 2 subunit 2